MISGALPVRERVAEKQRVVRRVNLQKQYTFHLWVPLFNCCLFLWLFKSLMFPVDVFLKESVKEVFPLSVVIC